MSVRTGERQAANGYADGICVALGVRVRFDLNVLTDLDERAGIDRGDHVGLDRDEGEIDAHADDATRQAKRRGPGSDGRGGVDLQRVNAVVRALADADIVTDASKHIDGRVVVDIYLCKGRSCS